MRPRLRYSPARLACSPGDWINGDWQMAMPAGALGIIRLGNHIGRTILQYPNSYARHPQVCVPKFFRLGSAPDLQIVSELSTVVRYKSRADLVRASAWVVRGQDLRRRMTWAAARPLRRVGVGAANAGALVDALGAGLRSAVTVPASWRRAEPAR